MLPQRPGHRGASTALRRHPRTAHHVELKTLSTFFLCDFAGSRLSTTPHRLWPGQWTASVQDQGIARHQTQPCECGPNEKDSCTAEAQCSRLFRVLMPTPRSFLNPSGDRGEKSLAGGARRTARLQHLSAPEPGGRQPPFVTMFQHKKRWEQRKHAATPSRTRHNDVDEGHGCRDNP